MSTNNVNIKLGELSFNGELALSEDHSRLIFGNGLGLAGKAKIAVEAVAKDPEKAGEEALMLGGLAAAKMVFPNRIGISVSDVQLETRDAIQSGLERHARQYWYLPVANILSVSRKQTELVLDTSDGPVYLYFSTPKKANAWCNVLWKLLTGKKLNLLERGLLT